VHGFGGVEKTDKALSTNDCVVVGDQCYDDDGDV